jgi:aryl-alcohol dehydrogenase-like predicted oxidoreductase
MEMRTLGKSGIKVSATGLGLMSMSGIYGNANDEESIRVIHYALDKGINFLDSSDMYGWGHNEELLGKALASYKGGRRSGVIVATKFGQTKLADGKQGVDGSPEYVLRACDASLKRLGIEVIDLYYQHRVDPNVPIEDTVGAMKRLIEAGKVRALGLSEARPETIRRANAIHPIAAVQNEYSLLYRVEGEETLATTRDLGISLIAYAPLGRSMLTGSVKGKADLPDGDRRLAHPRFQGDALDKNVKIVKRLEEISVEKKCTPAQLVLAWLLAQGKDIVPIPGTKRKSRVDENLAALDVRLSSADVKRISEIAPPGAGAGLRYPGEAMKRVYL